MKPEEFKQVYDSIMLDDGADRRILSKMEKRMAGGQNMGNRKYQKKYVKAAVAAVAGVLAVGSVGYAASVAWNANVAERFGVEDRKEMMQELSDRGFSKTLEGENAAGRGEDGTGKEDALSVTDNGITVTVRQTLADENCGYIYYEVEYGEEYTPVVDGADENADYNIAWPDMKLTEVREGEDRLSYSGGIMKVINDHKVGYECFFSPSNRGKLHDTVLNLQIRGFSMDTEKADKNPLCIATGNWSLSWKLSGGTQKRVYQIDKTVKIDGMDIYFEKLEVSPLACRVYMSTKDKKYKKLSDELEEPGVGKLQCGKKTFLGNGGGGYTNQKPGKNGKINIIEQHMFDKILDVDTLTGFYFGGSLISLEDTEYTIKN